MIDIKIIINEESDREETEIVINCKCINTDIVRILSVLKIRERKIAGNSNGETFILDYAQILYIDTTDKRTFLYTKDKVYETPLKLYELEQLLGAVGFVRVNKSAIINLQEVLAIKPEFNGRLLVTLANGEKIAVSRQYAVEIKKKLGVLS